VKVDVQNRDVYLESLGLASASGHVGSSPGRHESEKQRLPFGDAVDIEFFEPAEAAALMRCTESWLRDGATSGRFPHACWGKGKIIFTSEHILEIAKLSEILPGASGSPLSASRLSGKERLIGTRSKARLSTIRSAAKALTAVTAFLLSGSLTGCEAAANAL
jgi:hypothetical protein